MSFLTLLQETNKSEVYSCLSEMHRKSIEFVKKRYKKTIKELFSLNPVSPVSNDEFLFVIINDTYELNDESLTVLQKMGVPKHLYKCFLKPKLQDGKVLGIMKRKNISQPCLKNLKKLSSIQVFI